MLTLYAQLSTHYLKQGRSEEGANLLKKAYRIFFDNRDYLHACTALNLTAEHYLRIPNYALALQYFSLARQESEKYGLNSQRTRAIVGLSHMHLMRKELAKAKQILTMVPQSQRDCTYMNIRIETVVYEIKHGGEKTAEQELTLFKKECDEILNPADRITCAQQLADSLAAICSFDHAIDVIDYAIATEAESKGADQSCFLYITKAGFYSVRNRTKEAKAELRNALEIEQRRGRTGMVPSIHAAMGNLLAKENRIKEAEEELELAARGCGSPALELQLQHAHASILLQTHQQEKCLKVIETVANGLASDPGNVKDRFVQLSNICHAAYDKGWKEGLSEILDRFAETANRMNEQQYRDVALCARMDAIYFSNETPQQAYPEVCALIKQLEDLGSSDKFCANAYFVGAWFAITSNHTDVALNYLNQCARNLEHKDNCQYCYIVLQLITKLITAGNIPAAEAVLRCAGSSGARDPVLSVKFDHVAAEIKLRRGDLIGAYRSLSKVPLSLKYAELQGQTPEAVNILILKGFLASRLGRKEEAVELHRLALSVSPDETRLAVMLVLCDALTALRKLAEARAVLSDAEKLLSTDLYAEPAKKESAEAEIALHRGVVELGEHKIATARQTFNVLADRLRGIPAHYQDKCSVQTGLADVAASEHHKDAALNYMKEAIRFARLAEDAQLIHDSEERFHYLEKLQ